MPEWTDDRDVTVDLLPSASSVSFAVFGLLFRLLGLDPPAGSGFGVEAPTSGVVLGASPLVNELPRFFCEMLLRGRATPLGLGVDGNTVPAAEVDAADEGVGGVALASLLASASRAEGSRAEAGKGGSPLLPLGERGELGRLLNDCAGRFVT